MFEAWPDMVNGTLQIAAGGFIALSVWKLHHDKIVRGVSLVHVGFFMAWGFWNLYFFLHYDLWFSFAGGVGVVMMNAVWLSQLLYYMRLERKRLEAGLKPGSLPWKVS